MTDDELDDLTRRCAAGDPAAEAEYNTMMSLIEAMYAHRTRREGDRMAKGNTTSWLVGRTIAEVRPMTSAELQAEGWPDRLGRMKRVVILLVLDNGTRLYASCDEEGNGPGCLFGATPDGRNFALMP